MTEETRSKIENSQQEIASFFNEHGDAIDIFAGSPLPALSNGPVKAYGAKARDRSTSNYFALVCEKHLLPRLRAVSAYKSQSNPMLLPLASSGVTYWPSAREERYVFLYRNVLTKRIQQAGQPEAMGWRQETVMENIVRPMTTLLKEFRDTNFYHGGIRPSNMFADMATGKIQNVMLGDCLSMPPAYMQPLLYEPIERAMAQPNARGSGMIAEDLYAFGVTLAVILRTHDPLQGLSPQEIIQKKMELGSYVAITGKDRFKGSILELLRGLLHDDSKERWTIDEVMSWLDGQRLNPKQSFKRKKAARPLVYNSKKYLYSSFLAMDIDENLQEAVQIVDGGDLDQWLERSLEDEEMIERVSSGVKNAREKGVGPGYEERLTANLSMALDPHAPLRYKGLRLMGEGIGTALADAAIQRQDIQRFVELFSQGLAFSWLTSSQLSSLDQGSLIARFDQCRNFIRHGKPGYGVERCIYVLAPECFCLSEKLRNYYILTPEQLIIAFESLCQKSEAPAMFLDRHSMAFLSVKEPKVIDQYLIDLSSGEEYRRVLGNLRCLGALQKRFNLPMFPGIAKVFAEALSVVYARYHDRAVREKLEENIRKFSGEGDLAKMASLLSNNEVNQKDMIAFRAAMREYAELRGEHNVLVMRMRDKSGFGKTLGREIAAVFSAVIAGIVILASAIMFFTQDGIF